MQARLAKIRMVIFDVDGVLTDGKMHYGPDGETFKSFHVRDGLGIRFLKRAGIAQPSSVPGIRLSQTGVQQISRLPISSKAPVRNRKPWLSCWKKPD